MNIPSLGSRGEGWVALQFTCLALVVAGGLLPGTGIAGDPGVRWVVAGVLLFGGIALAGWGVAALRQARALTALPYPLAAGVLVETGAYRLARHPIYGGLILTAAGWAAVTASVPAAVATAVLAITLDLKRRREEAWLREHYPAYRSYQARTRALIPGLY
jgi:protein-S-isoprenylcysteine O-methyltransferase Ste14